MGKSDFRIHTFEEEIEFVRGLNHSTGKTSVSTRKSKRRGSTTEGKDIAASTLKVLKEYGYTSKQDKVYLQCFDANELKRIKMSWSRRWDGSQSGAAHRLYRLE